MIGCVRTVLLSIQCGTRSIASSLRCICCERNNAKHNLPCQQVGGNKAWVWQKATLMSAAAAVLYHESKLIVWLTTSMVRCRLSMPSLGRATSI